MKALHRPDLFGWSAFDEARNLDFNSVAWIRPEGNVLVDPTPMTAHDLEHLRSLGGAEWIVVTNSDHTRASAALADALDARVAGPRAERATLGIECERWLADTDEVVPGLTVLELEGSKTPGELALVLENTTLITGDLVRGQALGRLNLLPAPMLSDEAAAWGSVARQAALDTIEAVLVGDGWPIPRDGHARLQELLASR